MLTLAALLGTPFPALAQAPGAGAGLVALRGVIIDAASGEPVRRARVEVGTGPSRIGAVMSGNDGRFSLDVPANATTSAHIGKAGYASQTRWLSPQQLRESVPLLVALERGAAMVGRAVDISGQPVPLQGITVLRAREKTRPLSTLTPVTPDERGEFRVGGLAPGRYIIDNMAGPPTAGLRASPVEVQLEAGQEVPVVLLFEPTPTGDSQGSTGVLFDARSGTATSVMMPVPATPAGRAIRGVVTSSAGAPLSGANVVAAAPGGQRRGAMTDALGRFTIAGLVPGQYTVDASKRGYVRAEHGQRGLGLPGVKVAVGANADTEDVDILLPSAGAVSGIVYDEAGEPLQDAAIRLTRVRRSASGFTPVPDPTPPFVRTDDRGHFRAGNLPPGEYAASASLAAHLVTDGVRSAYATTYWPGAADLGGAATFEIRAGEEVAGLSFTLRLVPVVSVAGTVLTSVGTAAAGTVRLMRAAGADTGSDVRTMQIGSSGEFSFDDITSGEYVVQALASIGAANRESGRRLVTVAAADPVPVTIRTSPGSVLTGRFVLEGARPGDLMWGYSATAVAEGVSWTPATASNLGSPIADGEPFAMSQLTGPTRLRVTSDDENWYLKSILIDGFDAADGVFDFGFEGRRYADVQVVFSRLGATLTGRATDERARPVRDYAVYVFSTDRATWTAGSRWVRVARADADGAFRIPSLPPGSYWTVAVDRLDAAPGADPSDPALLDTLTPQAVSVVVGETETREIVLRVVRR